MLCKHIYKHIINIFINPYSSWPFWTPNLLSCSPKSSAVKNITAETFPHEKRREIKNKWRQWKNMGKGEHLQREVYFQNADFLILLLQKTVLQSSYLISANFSISSQPWQRPPSHTNKATVAETREEEEKAVIQEEGKDAAVLCPGHSGDGSFFQLLRKPQNKMAEHAVSGQHLTERDNWGTGEENTWIEDRELSNQVPETNQQLWAQAAPLILWLARCFPVPQAWYACEKPNGKSWALWGPSRMRACVQAWRREEATLTVGQGHQMVW